MIMGAGSFSQQATRDWFFFYIKNCRDYPTVPPAGVMLGRHSDAWTLSIKLKSSEIINNLIKKKKHQENILSLFKVFLFTKEFLMFMWKYKTSDVVSNANEYDGFKIACI